VKTEKKVTVHLPALLLKRAQSSTGLGITETIRKGLELLAAHRSYDALKKLRGKVHFSMSLEKLREDRE